MSRQSSASSRSSRPQSSSSKAGCSVEIKTINENFPIRGSSAQLISSARLSARPNSSRKLNKHQVVVVGAGISGLSACAKLIENGVTDIVLLEASDRVGGRINTIPFQKSFIEIGAQWIHGIEGNPVYDISDSIGNISDSKNKNDTMYYATPDGTKLDYKIVEPIIEKLHESIEKIQEELGEEDIDKSLGGLINTEIEKIIEEYDGEVSPELIKAICVSEISNERYESSCDNLNELSAVAWNSFEECGGDQFVNQKQGYIKVVEYLKSKLPNNAIRFNEQVEEINWNDIENEIIRIKTRSGSIYEANRVLISISVGCLKSHHQSLFNPSLPEEKVYAIENLGFGCVNKLFLVFDQPLTEYEFDGLQIFYRNDINFNLDSIKKWNLKKTDFFKELTELDKLPNHDNILLVFSCGETAIYLESLEDECIIDIFHEIISKCFPDLGIPRPKSILRSKWHSAPTIQGSYTYLKAGTSPSIISDLAKPIGKCLYFSGEGTTSSYTGTVHGAFITGKKQGDLISESINN